MIRSALSRLPATRIAVQRFSTSASDKLRDILEDYREKK